MVPSPWMRAALALWVTPVVFAENRLYFDPVTLPLGETAASLTLKADNDQPIVAFSFGLDYDETLLTAVDVIAEGTLAAEAPANGFFNGDIDTEEGKIGYGCVLDFTVVPSPAIPVGTGRELARVILDVIASEDGSTDLVFTEVYTTPGAAFPVINAFTDEAGQTIRPTVNTPGTGTIVLEDRAPRISSLEGNEGEAGSVFTVVGEFFQEDGLAVTVCDTEVEPTLEADGRTLRITAPDCTPSGWAELRVCTVRGCATEPNGFLYASGALDFTRGDSNRDTVVDISDGVHVLLYLFLGTVSSTCLDSLDADDTGVVELTDAVYILNYLFLGGPVLPPPFPGLGPDPTDDELPACQ